MTDVAYEFIPIKESNDPLVDLGEYDFLLEPSYFAQGLSKTDKMYLRKTVADKLLTVQKKLGSYRLKIWDAYRSREVQKNIYQKYWKALSMEHPDWSTQKLETEVAVFVTATNDPSRIPPHASGGAVDLTLVDVNDQALAMGTAFDYFGPEAEPFYFEKKNTLVNNNRLLLRESMLEEGFRPDKDEWWHFDYGNQIWAAHYKKSHATFGEVS